MSSPADPMPTQPSASPIDSEVWSVLREDVDAEDLLRVLSLYLEAFPGRVAGVREAIERLDGDALARVAHPLKSASRQIGALHLGALCEQLEQAGRDGGLERALPLLPVLEQEVVEVHRALQALLESGLAQ
ncbi:MAG: Hpt domain-containing protein [Magnetococcus sp. MYC-9]